jgi:hypothetical protein
MEYQHGECRTREQQEFVDASEREEENQQSQHDPARSLDDEFPKLQIAWSMMARRTGFTPSRSQIAAGTVPQRT